MHPEEYRLKSLLVSGLDGNRAAYKEFLSQTSLLLRSYVTRQLRRMGQQDGDAEDIVQEAILAIHSKGHTYDPTVPVTAWIHAIARYKLIDFLRTSRQRLQALPLEDVAETGATASEQFEVRHTVRKTLESLPTNLRVPVELMKLEGLSVAETAARTGMSQSAVKVNVHRGIKALVAKFGSNK